MYEPLIASMPIDLSSPINWSHPLNQGRVSWWKVIGNSGWRGGATLRDLVRGSGHNPNDGALVGGATWLGSAGRPGGQGCLSFDGSTGYVDVPRQPDLEPANLTVSSWINIRTVPVSGTLVFLDKTTATVESYLFQIDSSPFVYFNTTSVQVNTVNAVPTSTWMMVTGTYDGVNVNIYLNGVFQASSALTPPITYQATDLFIGAYNGGSTPFAGLMDDVAIWSRALSPGEINALYLLSRQGYPGLLNRLSLSHGLVLIADEEVLTNSARIEW